MKRILLYVVLCAMIISCLPAAALEKEDWLSPDQYYAQQLSAEHRRAWEKDLANVLSYPNQTKMTKDRRQQALASMIKNDNPRIFWIDWIDSNAMLRFDTGNTAHYEGVQMPGGKTLANYQAFFAFGVKAAAEEISRGLPRNADAKAIAKAVYKWLRDNNEYNDAQTSSHKKESDPVSFAYMAAHSAYSAIIKGDEYLPVCDGYALGFKVLCDELGVTSICVSGSMKNIPHHMWNYVQLENGKWYLVDVTCGDTSNADVYCLMGAGTAANYAYTPNPYMGSGVNPSNGYTEGAAFTVPKLAEN